MSEPTPLQMVHELHEAVFGTSWARPESPERVWAMLLDRVRDFAQGKCAACLAKNDGPDTEMADGLIADAYQLIDWWLNAREQYPENRDRMSAEWIERAVAWSAVSLEGKTP